MILFVSLLPQAVEPMRTRTASVLSVLEILVVHKVEPKAGTRKLEERKGRRKEGKKE